MFNNIEEKLKSFAVVNVLCGVLGAIAYLSNFIHSKMLPIHFIWGLIILLIGYFSSLFIYAFAEFLENVKQINATLHIHFEPEISKGENADQMKTTTQVPKKDTKEARITAYWAKHPEEHQLLLEQRAEAENELRNIGGAFSGAQRAVLQGIIQSINEELNKDRDIPSEDQ